MKYLLTLGIVLAAAILMGADTATFIGHDKVADALAKGGSLTATKDYTVSGAHRNGPGQVEVHDKETDILYIIDGEATFVTTVAKAITESMSTSVGKVLETAKKFFGSLSPSVTMDEEGKPALTFGLGKHARVGPALDEVLEYMCPQVGDGAMPSDAW